MSTTNPYASGGGGEQFESRVGAHYLSLMLARTAVIGLDTGPLATLAFQTGSEGWLLDDLLLTVDTPEGISRLALQVRSNFTPTHSDAGFRDLLNKAWRHFLGQTSVEFNISRDKIGIATGFLNLKVKQHLFELLRWAKSIHDSKIFFSRVRDHGPTSKEKRGFLELFSCPVDVSPQKTSDEQFHQFLRALVIVDFDFNSPNSASESTCIERCQQVLEEPDPPKAQLLWQRLIIIAGDHKKNGGTLDCPHLLRLITPHVRLKDVSDFSEDWKRLREYSRSFTNLVPTKIGQTHVLREHLLAKLSALVIAYPTTVVLGEPGCGKSSLLCEFLEERQSEADCLWCDAASLDQSSLAAWSNAIGLTRPLRQILDTGNRPQQWLVVDRVDRLVTDKAIKCFAQLLVAAGIQERDYDQRRRVIISCRTEDWPRVSAALIKCSMLPEKWARFETESFNDNEVAVVLAEHPALAPLWRLSHLRQLLRRPLFLQILVENSASLSSESTDQWIGEPHFADWFWNQVVQQHGLGLSREKALLILAREQAMSLRNAIPTTKLTTDSLPSLLSDKICLEAHSSVKFAHDVYADWARLRLLLQEEIRLAEYIGEIGNSPLLVRPLRLLALHFLEVRRDKERWIRLLRELHDSTGQPTQWYYVALDAVVFSSQPLTLLRELREFFLADDARLMGQLLNRLVYVATVPDPRLPSLVGEMEDDLASLIRAQQRFPLPQYWWPILQFLRENCAEFATKIPGHITQAIYVWLSTIPAELKDYRNGVGEIALAVYNSMRDLEEADERIDFDSKSRKQIYQNLLLSVDSIPNDVEAFLHEHANLPDTEGRLSDLAKVGEDRSLREVLLEPQSVSLLCVQKPTLLRDALVSVLVDRSSDEEDTWLGDKDLGIHDEMDWIPPSYAYGPFLLLLRANPSAGKDLVLMLVEYATAKWKERSLRHGWGTPLPQTVKVNNQERQLWGDNQVFCWHRGTGVAPYVIQVALMALEKWLYEKLDVGEETDDDIAWLLDHTSSVAIAGLLITVSLKKPGKAEKWIEPLMSCPVMYEWDLVRQLNDQTQTGFLASLDFNKPDLLRKLLREWNSLPHRQDNFELLVCRSLLTSESLQARLLPAIRSFPANPPFSYEEQRTRDKYVQDAREKCVVLASRLDPANYQFTQQEDGQTLIEYVAPSEHQAIAEAHQKATEIPQLLLSFPLRCVQIFETGQGIAEPDLENFWATIHKIESSPTGDPEDDEPSRREDSLCGGAAVLLRFHSDWLAKYPDRADWCRQTLLNHVTHPPTSSKYDSPVAHCPWAWDRFAARAIPHLWADCLDSAEFRRTVCLLTANPHHETVLVLFSELKTVRNHLGPGYWQIFRFAVECAEQRGRSWRDQDKQRYEQWLNQRVKTFAVGKSSSSKLLLSKIPLPKVPSEVRREPIFRGKKLISIRRDRRRSKRRLWLDVRLVQSAYSSLPRISECSDPIGRDRIKSIWIDALQFSINSLRESDGEMDFEGHADEWDMFLFDRLCELIIDLRATENLEVFWKPILELGERASKWVGEFLCEWQLAGNREPEPKTRFCSEWRAMIRFALDGPNWQFPDTYYRWGLQRLLPKLIGSDLGMGFSWKTDDWKPLTTIKDLLEEWVSKHAHRPDCLRGLIHLLTRPGFSLLPVPGLKWLQESLRKGDSRLIWNHGTAEDVALLLDKLWTKRRPSIISSQGVKDVFLAILDMVVARQIPLALQLQQRIIVEL